jgi:eukaryotic-like serine/threonine-protein kinase
MTFELNQPAYRALRDVVAERTSPLLAWVGSGLSIPAGLPTWSSLEEQLTETLERKAIGLEPADARSLEAQAKAIRKQADPWVSFKMLREGLGKTTYRETVREAFAAAPTVAIPDVYRQIWDLRIRGLLNLNLDRLAARAYSDSHPGGPMVEVSGRAVSRLRHLLNGHQPFIGNLHGVSDDFDSWVFTKPDLDALVREESYRTFIEACLSFHTVLFIGLSADDVAVGGHLERLASLNIETPAHYWITDRRDAATDRWAEDAGIRVIRYDANPNHETPLAELFGDLTSYLSFDAESSFTPVVPNVVPAEKADLPPVDELVKLDAESIRRILNETATNLLSEGTGEDRYSSYEDFAKRYDRAIYVAWYTTTEAPENELLGYQLKKEVARGSFGRVYEANTLEGKRVAVKVLLGEVRTNPDMLRSFRRGVRSMRILQQHDVDGMVSYLTASEIPAFVVMEWIDGPNLADATHAGYLNSWDAILRVAVQLSRIIRNAHELPERVLHRDLRPSNVMLRDYYTDQDAWSVVVLDFDLSWHKGAFEQSVMHTSAAGYLAPEQLKYAPGVSTRNAAVDSFGLGMTLLFLCSKEDPFPDQHRHQDWKQSVRRATGKIPGSGWESVPERFSRLIIAATEDEQAARWDMAEIAGEVERLYEAVVSPDAVVSVELLVEEVAARSEVLAGYTWNADKVGAETTLISGMQIGLEADLESERIRLRLDWASTGSEDRRNLGKYVRANALAAVDRLRAGGWGKITDEISARDVVIDASITAHEAVARAEDVAESIDRATRDLLFQD